MAKNVVYEQLLSALETRGAFGAEFVEFDVTKIKKMYFQKGSDESDIYIVLDVEAAGAITSMCFQACRGWRFTSDCYHIDKVHSDEKE